MTSSSSAAGSPDRPTARVLGRRGFRSVLKRQAAFRAHVSDEYMQALGWAEMMRLDLGDVLEDAGGIL